MSDSRFAVHDLKDEEDKNGEQKLELREGIGYERYLGEHAAGCGGVVRLILGVLALV